MPTEYTAVALGLVGSMFFLLEFGTRLNLQTSGRGIIDINDIAKSTFMILSFVVGIALALFMYSVSSGNSAAIDSILVAMISFWVFVTCFLLLFLIIYYWVVIPKLLDKVKE